MCEFFNDEIISIEYIGEHDTIDIETDGNHLFYANNILTHNSAVEEIEYDHSHIAGGISKINTADNVFGIFTSRSMRERGKYQLQLMKTRNSGGIGQKIDLNFDINSLRIIDSEEQSEETESDTKQETVTTSKTNTILDSIKKRKTTESTNDNSESRSGKLREFLQNLGDSEFDMN